MIGIYSNLARKLNKLNDMEETVIPILVGAFSIDPKSLGKETEGKEDLRKNYDHQDHTAV